MTSDILRENVHIELSYLRLTVAEMLVIDHNSIGRELTATEKFAVAAQCSQCYTGIETILKQFCKYYRVPVPTGNASHAELFSLFTTTRPYHQLPLLFPTTIEDDMIKLRKLRHVVLHGYAFQLQSARLQMALHALPPVLHQFFALVELHI
jgi:hypothetical protein